MSYSHSRHHHSSLSGSASSHHHHSIAHHQPSVAHYQPNEGPSPEPRRRRGRQARPTNLTDRMQEIVKSFCNQVGRPNVVDPAGFRDFRGWLSELNGSQNKKRWEELIARIASEVKCNVNEFINLKEDIVREIIKNVVIPRDQESSKLVSTNAGRQSGRPKSGTTLMILLDQHFAKYEKRLPELVRLYPAPSTGMSSSAGTSDVMRPTSYHPQQRSSHSSSSGGHASRHALPGQHNRLPRPLGIGKPRHPDERLPSFQELTYTISQGMPTAHHQRPSSSRRR